MWSLLYMFISYDNFTFLFIYNILLQRFWCVNFWFPGEQYSLILEMYSLLIYTFSLYISDAPSSNNNIPLNISAHKVCNTYVYVYILYIGGFSLTHTPYHLSIRILVCCLSLLKSLLFASASHPCRCVVMDLNFITSSCVHVSHLRPFGRHAHQDKNKSNFYFHKKIKYKTN